MRNDDYDVAQICLNGHVINMRFRGNPKRNTKYCASCGRKTITSCQECKEEIRGDLITGFPIASLGPDPAPSYCIDCGKPYPWTQDKIDAFRELVTASSSLSQDNKKVLSDGVEHVISDTPKTQLICARFVDIISKGSPLRSALLDIATGPAKEFLEKFWADVLPT